MFNWWKRAPAPSRLAVLLADYPALTPPHLGSTGAAPEAGQPVLTLEQCRENLRVLVDAMPERLVLLGGVLERLGLDSGEVYNHPETFVTRLHAILLTELPPLHRPELKRFQSWEMSTRAGPHIILSFMADLALLEMDVLMRAKPGCFIGLDLDPEDRAMTYWRRPCLLGLSDRLFPHIQYVYPVEEEWFDLHGLLDDPGRLIPPGHVMPETWGRVIGGGLLQRLDRDIVDPDLDEKLRTTWLGKARAV